MTNLRRKKTIFAGKKTQMANHLILDKNHLPSYLEKWDQKKEICFSLQARQKGPLSSDKCRSNHYVCFWVWKQLLKYLVGFGWTQDNVLANTWTSSLSVLHLLFTNCLNWRRKIASKHTTTSWDLQRGLIYSRISISTHFY